VRGVAKLADPAGTAIGRDGVGQGIGASRETCPLGVVAVVFESRPTWFPQVASLALKSGNAIFTEGRSGSGSHKCILMAIWRKRWRVRPSARRCSANAAFTRGCDGAADAGTRRDLLIPRGGKTFVEKISRQSRIPVLGHGEGICHVYVHAAADLQEGRMYRDGCENGLPRRL